MSRATKIIFAAFAVLGFACGVVLGYGRGKQASNAGESVYLMSGRHLKEFVVQQFQHADADHARQAVMLEIKVLELAERAAPGPMYEGDLAYAYVRLAMVEEIAGQLEAERAALDQARVYFKRLHPQREPTDDAMKYALTRMDEAWDRM